jgi:hypothetical protein
MYALISYLSMCDIIAKKKKSQIGKKVLFLSQDTLCTMVDEWNKDDRVSTLN